jgi:hypothetical protein
MSIDIFCICGEDMVKAVSLVTWAEAGSTWCEIWKVSWCGALCLDLIFYHIICWRCTREVPPKKLQKNKFLLHIKLKNCNCPQPIRSLHFDWIFHWNQNWLHVLWLGLKWLPLEAIDGLSWGEKQVGPLLHGWVAGILPLHLAIGIWAFPGFEKLAFLLGWPNLKFLEPIDWFYAVQQGGDYSLPQWDETWAWILALAAALNALEELRKGQLKRHKMHYEVVIVQLYWPASGIKRGHILHNSGRIPQQLEHVGVRIANDWIVSSSLTT